MYLNKQFKKFGNTYENILSNTVTQEMLHSLSRREKIYDDIGYKFAVYIICVNEKIPKLNNFSVELCRFYIQLNEKLHPPTVPPSVVMNAIRELKRAMDEPLLGEYSITDKVLDEIEHFS
jgi:hypothetical protein